MSEHKETTNPRAHRVRHALILGATLFPLIAVIVFMNISPSYTGSTSLQAADSSSTCQPSSMSLSDDQGACTFPFTVTGHYHDPPPNFDGSQDTHVPGSSCNLLEAVRARAAGAFAATLMQLVLGSPDGANFLNHFLDDTGTDMTAGSKAVADLPQNFYFSKLESAVENDPDIPQQLLSGSGNPPVTIHVSSVLNKLTTDELVDPSIPGGMAMPVVPPSLYSPVAGYVGGPVTVFGQTITLPQLPISDLYWAFRGTQGVRSRRWHPGLRRVP